MTEGQVITMGLMTLYPFIVMQNTGERGVCSGGSHKGSTNVIIWKKRSKPKGLNVPLEKSCATTLSL